MYLQLKKTGIVKGPMVVKVLNELFLAHVKCMCIVMMGG